MSAFYQQYLTDKSFSLLTDLRKKYKFILIGGWAVYFYTQALKSKDIDIIIDFSELQKIKKDFPMDKNDRLKKYQIKLEEIDVDIYLPFYSNLGIPVKDILLNTENVNGFILLKKEILLITKLAAYHDRKSSVKGQKDLIDIISLILLPNFDFKYFLGLAEQYKLKEYLEELIKIFEKTKEVEELNLNQYSFAKKKRKVISKFSP